MKQGGAELLKGRLRGVVRTISTPVSIASLGSVSMSGQRVVQRLGRDGQGYIIIDENIGDQYCMQMEEVETVDAICRKVEDEEMAMLFNAEDIEGTQVLLAQRDGNHPIGTATRSSLYPGRRITIISDVLRRRIARNILEKQTWKKMVSSVMNLAGECTRVFGEPYAASGPVLLRSLGNCPRQLLHVDRDAEEMLPHAPSLSALLFLQEEAHLVIFKGGHRHISRNVDNSTVRFGFPTKEVDCSRDLKCKKGKFLLFRRDMPHRGSSTGDFNQRLFFELIPIAARPTKSLSTERLNPAESGDGYTYPVLFV